MVSQEGKSPEPGDLTELLAKVNAAGVNRRRFLKGAGIGSLALASLPTVGSALARKAFAGDLLGFHLVTVSGVPNARNLMVFAGAGQIHDAHISGWGRWFHFLDPAPGAAGPPEVVGYGTWSPKELTNFNNIGSGGGFAAGIMDWVFNGTPASGATITLPARIVCNIEPAGLDTGLHEGLYLPEHPAGAFEPLHPELGLSAFLQM